MIDRFLERDEFVRILRHIDNGTENREKVCNAIKVTFGNNLRLANVLSAKPPHFQLFDGQPFFLVQHDKTSKGAVNPEWYPIPYPTYNDIIRLIKKYGIKDNEYIFLTHCKNAGVNCGHEGVVSVEWIEKLWYSACKKEGLYMEYPVIHKTCRNCPHALPNKRCNVRGEVKSRMTIHIRNCKALGMVEEKIRKWPWISKTVRGAGATSKVKDLIHNHGYKPSQAFDEVFNMSNWKSRKVFMEHYIEPVFKKDIAKQSFVENFGDLNLS